MASEQRVSGHNRVEERVGLRVWVASYTRSDGSKSRKTLGPAWVKDSGRRTPRGAVVWRTASGPKPDDRYLTPSEASDALDELLKTERAQTGASRAGRGKTFGEVTDAWLLHTKTVRNAAPSTISGYRSVVNCLNAEEFPKITPLPRITASRVTNYQADLLTGPLGFESVHRRIVVLRRILNFARKQGWVTKNVVDDVEIVAQPGTSPDFNVLEPSQVEQVAQAVALVPDREPPRMRNDEICIHALAAMQERRTMWAEVVRFAAFTGVRFGELRALYWRDINIVGQAVWVRRNAPTSAPAGSKAKAPKSGRGRSVPLISRAIDVLDRIRAAGYPDGPNDLVFPSRGEGMLDAGRVRDAFYRGLIATGLGHLREKDNPMTFHDLRHTFGTIAVRVFPLTDVQAMLGHADIQTTMRYVHSVPRDDAAALLARAFASDLNTQPAEPELALAS
jgi:integrase